MSQGWQKPVVAESGAKLCIPDTYQLNLTSSENRELPDDIIFNILVRLPGRCIIRCRCVSKKWHALTSDSYFTINHNLGSKLSVLVCGSSDTPVRYNVYALPLRHNPVERTPLNYNNLLMKSVDIFEMTLLLGCCNGLLCFSRRCDADSLSCINGRCHSGKAYFYIHNPLTNQWITLPPGDCSARGIFAFYFDSRSSEYKLLWCSNSFKGSLPEVKILTVGASSWRTIKYLPPSSPLLESFPLEVIKQCVLLDTNIHWLPYFNKFYQANWFILVFDTISEKFHMMSSPPLQDTQYSNTELFLFEKKLAMSIALSETQIELWVLEDYVREEWVLKHIIDILVRPTGMPLKIFSADDGDLFIYYQDHLVVFNAYKRTTISYACDLSYGIKEGLLYQESLIQHEFFKDGGLHLPPSRSIIFI